MRDVWTKVAHTSGATVVSVLASLASLMLTARLLGPAGRGVYAAVVAWVGFVAVLGSLSLGQVVVHHVAGRAREEWLPEVTGTLLALCGAAAVVGWGVCALLYAATGGALFGHVSPLLLALGLAPLPLLLWSDSGRYLLNALDALGVANWAQVGGAIVNVAGIGLLVLALGGGVAGALAAYAVGAAVAGVVMLRAVVRLAGRLRVSAPLGRRLLAGAAQLHVNAVGNFLYAQASVLVLNYYRPAAETGQYQLAMQLFSLALLVSSAVGTVSFGLVARLGPDGAWPAQRRLLAQSLAAIAVLAAVGFALAPLAVRLVAGERFLPAASLFRAVVPALPGATLSTVMASQWVGRGLFRQAALLTLVVGIASLACDLLLIPRHGMRGAVVSTLATYAISVVGNGAMVWWVQGRWRRAGAPTGQAEARYA